MGGRPEELVARELKLNFPVLGAKLGPAMKEVARAAKEGAWTLSDGGPLCDRGHTLAPGEYELAVRRRGRGRGRPGPRLLVVLDTRITDELRREGYAREIIRCVQDLRKQAGLQRGGPDRALLRLGRSQGGGDLPRSRGLHRGGDAFSRHRGRRAAGRSVQRPGAGDGLRALARASSDRPIRPGLAESACTRRLPDVDEP